MVETEIENLPVCMEIDTSSGKAIISENLWKDKFSNKKSDMEVSHLHYPFMSSKLIHYPFLDVNG